MYNHFLHYRCLFLNLKNIPDINHQYSGVKTNNDIPINISIHAPIKVLPNNPNHPKNIFIETYQQNGPPINSNIAILNQNITSTHAGILQDKHIPTNLNRTNTNNTKQEIRTAGNIKNARRGLAFPCLNKS